MQNRDRLFYQYALLNLSILQADFGCYKEAVDSMLETVSTARENRDMTCLNFSLNWLFHFSRAHPQLLGELESKSMLNNGKESLTFLRIKAKETGMWVLWSSALLSEAKLSLSNADSLAIVFENMIRSSQVLIQKNLKTMFGGHMSMSIALWDRLGIASLSNITSEVYLRCHSGNSIFEDELRITCRLAGLLSSKGRYDEAFEKLESLESNSLRSWKSHQYWEKMRGIIKLSRELHRNNLSAAEHLLSQLLQSKPEDMEPDMVFILDCLHIDYLIRRSDLSKAFDKVETMINTIEDDDHTDISIKIRLMLLKAQLFDLAGRPQRGFTICIRATTLAWKARIMPLLWQAIGSLANVLTSLGEFDAAIDIIIAVLPRCLESDTPSIAAQLYMLLADAFVGEVGIIQEKSLQQQRRREEYLIRAKEALINAFDLYTSIEDIQKQCEVLAKSSTVMKIAGDETLAEDYASRYLLMRREADMRNS
jgi:anaphase-promoting complex subunit 5